MNNTNDTMRNELLGTLQRVMKESSRAITCEAQLQFDLAWEIRKKFGDKAKIHLEYAVKITDDKGEPHVIRYDIVIQTEKGEYIPIELKFKTKLIKGYEYTNQSAQDLARFDFWADVERIEKFEQWTNKPVSRGYAILVTNDQGYWNCAGEKRLYEQFSTKCGRSVSGELCWEEDYNPETVGKKRDRTILLKNTYEVIWDDVLALGDKAKFRALILEIKK